MPFKLKNDNNYNSTSRFVLRDGNLYDLKLKTDDGTIVLVHKLALDMVSPYFRAMFTN